MEQSCHSQCRVFTLFFPLYLNQFYDVRNLLSWPRGSRAQWERRCSRAQARFLFPPQELSISPLVWAWKTCSPSVLSFPTYIGMAAAAWFCRGGGEWESGFPGLCQSLTPQFQPILVCLTHLALCFKVNNLFLLLCICTQYIWQVAGRGLQHTCRGQSTTLWIRFSLATRWLRIYLAVLLPCLSQAT